jgi:hypothetical protein
MEVSLKMSALGTVVTFEYLLDISSSVEPDTYELELNITYVKEGKHQHLKYTHKLNSFALSPISFRVVDAYFSPASYPGSVDTNLYVYWRITAAAP